MNTVSTWEVGTPLYALLCLRLRWPWNLQTLSHRLVNRLIFTSLKKRDFPITMIPSLEKEKNDVPKVLSKDFTVQTGI